jgi:hypothetical protein
MSLAPEVINFAGVAVIIVGLVGSLGVMGVAISAAFIKLNNRTKAPVLEDARLEQIQQSIDAIAVEVERIAEAQRFSAKLLAERAPDNAAIR